MGSVGLIMDPEESFIGEGERIGGMGKMMPVRREDGEREVFEVEEELIGSGMDPIGIDVVLRFVMAEVPAVRIPPEISFDGKPFVDSGLEVIW